MAKNLKGYLNEPDTGAGDAGHEVFEPEPPRMPDASVLARGHEHGDIGIAGLLSFAAAMVVATGLVFVGVWYLMVVMQGLEQRSLNARYAPVSDLTAGDAAAAAKGREGVRNLPRDHFPEPRLQPSAYHPRTDKGDMKLLHAKQEAELIQNGWERDPRSGGLKLSGRAIAASGAFLGASNGAATRPATTRPAAMQTVETRPATSQPVTTDSTPSQPSTAESALTQPALTQPALTQPALTQPAATQPAGAESTATQPGATPNDAAPARETGGGK